MRDLSAISSGSSKILSLPKGKGFISVSGTFNTAEVDIQFINGAGAWETFSDADGKTSNFQYEVSTGGAPVSIRATIATGTPTGTLQVSGGAEGDGFNQPT